MVKNRIQENIVLAPLTSFKIGGAARYFAAVENKEELLEVLAWAEKNRLPFQVVGGGSNLLVSDRGFDGLVIKMANAGLSVRGERIECGAGAPLAKALSVSVGHALAGLEWAIGIPGTVGGAIIGNAGARGSTIADIIETVAAYNYKQKRSEILSRSLCRFGYRGSLFKEVEGYVIISAILKLQLDKKEEIERREQIFLNQRLSSQPKLPSAGSVFKNIDAAAVSNSQAIRLAEKEKMIVDGQIPAGWLIDHLGLRGKKIGGAKISLEHANFIVNAGDATAEDVVMLVSFIKQQVRTKLGVQLHEEIRYVGF